MGAWIGTIIGALFAGIIIGPLARLVMPGKQDIGIFATIVAGPSVPSSAVRSPRCWESVTPLGSTGSSSHCRSGQPPWRSSASWRSRRTEAPPRGFQPMRICGALCPSVGARRGVAWW